MKNLTLVYGIILRVSYLVFFSINCLYNFSLIVFLFQYCLISLLYDPLVRKYKPELLNRFLEGVTHCKNKTEIHEFLQNIYQIEPTKTPSIIMDSFTLETDAEDNDTDSDSDDTTDDELNINTENEIKKNINVENIQNNIENVQTHQANRKIVRKKWRTHNLNFDRKLELNNCRKTEVDTNLNKKQPTNDGKTLELNNFIKTEEVDTNNLKKKKKSNDGNTFQLKKLELINNIKIIKGAKKIKLKKKKLSNDGNDFQSKKLKLINKMLKISN